MSANTVIAGVIVATGLNELDLLLEGKETFEPVISGFIVGTVLLTIALFSEPVATMLALLLVITAVLTKGLKLMKRLNKPIL
jgi:hypothetical protein